MKLGNKIKKIRGIDAENFSVRLLFADGTAARVDLADIFSDGRKKPLVAEILRGNMFDKCFVENGALAWPNGFELCPDTLWERTTKSRERRVA